MSDFEAIRTEFPVTQTCVLLNHAAARSILLRARDAVHQLLTDHAEKTVTNHAEKAVTNHAAWVSDQDTIRARVARLVNGDKNGVSFVQNTSSGLSLAANGIQWKPGDNVIVPACEFPSNIYPWTNLEHLGWN